MKVGFHLDMRWKKNIKIKKRWEYELDCSCYWTVIVFKHFFSRQGGFKAVDLEWMRVISNNIVFGGSCLKCGWQPAQCEWVHIYAFSISD